MLCDDYFCVYPECKHLATEMQYIQNLIEIYTADPYIGWFSLDRRRLENTFLISSSLYCLKSLLQPILEVHFSQTLINKAFSTELSLSEIQKAGFCNVTFNDKRTRFIISDLQELKSKFLLEQEYLNVHLDMKCQDLQRLASYVRGKIPVTKKIFQDLEYLKSDFSSKAAAQLLREFFTNITYFP